MSKDPSETLKSDHLELANKIGSASSQRRLMADFLPFFMRGWWLRDYAEYSDLQIAEGGTLTQPLWSLHTDPMCDIANSNSNV